VKGFLNKGVNMLYIRLISIVLIGVFQVFTEIQAQPVPGIEENIPFMETFGKEGDSSWGDDDFCQIFFFMVPKSRVEPIFLRIYDPDTFGDNDEPKGSFNTQISYSIYGGSSCWSNKDAQEINPVNNYKSGVLIASKTFGAEPQYNEKWFSFGPINPFEGELVEKFGGRVFKIIAQGVKGDDGNLYKYFLSAKPNENKEIEGGNFFTYEYTFRLANDTKQVSQIYPYIDDKTTSVNISNFDWDNDGIIKIISVAKNGLLSKISGEGDWVVMNFPIIEEEKNTSLEVQFIKNQKTLIKNNNVSIVVQNQYGISLPFYVIPIGGIPVYNPKIRMISVD
jgi:hypothetical protein